MNPFSIGGAWSLGLRFIAGRAREHAILLLGLGLLVPFALQYSVGLATGAADPMAIEQGGAPGATPAGRAAAILVVLVGILLQLGSFFASWRIGMDRSETFGRALMFGLLAALIALGVIGLLGSAAALAASQAGPPGIVVFVILFTLLPIIVAIALFFTLFAALIASGLALTLVVAMLFGISAGQAGLAATLVGGSGFVVVLLLILSAFMLWLTARLSCTTAVMADRRSFNLIAAVRSSWQLTWEDQLRIMGHLLIVGLGLALLLVAGAFAIGAGIAGLEVADSTSAATVAGLALGLTLAAPFAFFAVIVPAGIYRELGGATAPVAEVFA